MTIPMPDPMVEVDKQIVSSELQYTYLAPSGGLEHGTHLITTIQAEAYAAAKVREAQRWHPIDSAPHETLVVLGWYDENEVFKQEIALASAGRRYPGGASDMWWHGRATHWMPLPAPPLPGPVEPTT